MADVRLTATNPEDSSVVPVACDSQGRLRVEPPQLVEGPPGEKGDKGDQGDAGPKGDQGDPGVDAPQWESGTWTPEYGSTSNDGELNVTYKNQSGVYYKLGNMVWVKGFLSTQSLQILGLRGDLLVRGFPFTWTVGQESFKNGVSIDLASGFRDQTFIPFAVVNGARRVLSLRKQVDGEWVEPAQLIDLHEHVEGTARNSLRFSYFGQITSTYTSPLKYVDGKLVGYEPDH